VAAEQFEVAIRAFEAAVGREWVYTSDDDLGPYRDSFSTVWNTGEERRASAALAPDSVEQVQAIVRIASRHRIPLFPISTGKNFGYGGPSPNLHGSVIVDLKRMNRVIEVDADLIGEPVYASPLAALTGAADFRATITRPGGPSDAEMDRYALDHRLPSWQVELQFYGPEKTCLANWEYASERLLGEIPGARAVAGESLAVPLTPRQLENVDAPYRSSIRRLGAHGVPTLGIWKIVSANGHAGFFPIIPRTGEAVFEAQHVLCDALRDFDLQPFFTAVTAPLHWYPFAFQMVFAPQVYRDDPPRHALVHRAMQRVVAVAAEHGWGDYRAATVYQDAVADTYSFNGHALRRFNETLRDAVDPEGILAPGRDGIWPRRFRDGR
jgi:4-cresol dehydrogenase (hydroxylating)